MIALASLALLTISAPSILARSGPGVFGGGPTFGSVARASLNSPSRRSAWVSRSRNHAATEASSVGGGESLVRRSCHATEGSGKATCAKEWLDRDSSLALLRGGGTANTDSVFTLFVRVFLPKYRRAKMAKEEEDDGLDLEGGGLLRRLRRLLSGMLSNITGFSGGSKDAKGIGGKAKSKKKAAVTGKGKGKGKGKAMTSQHLDQTYRPGNANYRIQKELKEFMTNPPDNCKVSVGKNIRVWIITISGAEGTVYAGEKFRLRVAFPEDYPTKPPAVYFLQSPPPPKHQHIYTNGDICLSLLSSRDWKPNLTVMSLALSILSMLSSAKEKRLPEDNAAHAAARPGQGQEWIYHDDLC